MFTEAAFLAAGEDESVTSVLDAAKWEKVGVNTGNFTFANVGADLVITATGAATLSGLVLKASAHAARTDGSYFATYKTTPWNTGVDQVGGGIGARYAAGPDWQMGCLARTSGNTFQIRSREVDNGVINTIGSSVSLGGAGYDSVFFDAEMILDGVNITHRYRRTGTADAWKVATGLVEMPVAAGRAGIFWHGFNSGTVITVSAFSWT